ncbi:MAG: VOC family protein [Burkholderiaceae bacterium]
MSAKTNGAHHIGLTVPDLAATRDFFIEALGFQQVGEKPDYPAVFVSDGTLMITLWRATDPATAVKFNRHTNIGLHHLSLKVGSEQALLEIAASLAVRADVTIEFTPEALGQSGLKHMMCHIPGEIRLELIGA